MRSDRRARIPVGLILFGLVAAVVTATAVVFAVMQMLILPRLMEISAGLRPFDTRFFGYDRPEAIALLKALGPVGRADYLGLQLPLDTVFPPLYTVTASLALAEVLGRAGLGRGWAFAAAFVVVAPTALLDLAENAAIAEMLRRPPDAVGAELVAAASLRTVAKWCAAAVGLVVAGLAALLALRRTRRNHAP